MKLLAYCDDPSGATGYSRQAKNILTRFHQNGFQIACIGINKVDESPLRPFDDDRMPFKVFRANIDSSDPEGKSLLIKVFNKLSPDVLLVIGDIWSFNGWFAQWLEHEQFRTKFKTIGYYSCEYPLNDEDREILSLTDYPICHSKWGLGFQNGAGYDVIKNTNKDLIYIPDSVDVKSFHYSSEDQRETDRASLGMKPDHYVIANVNRNFARKDIPSTIRAFKRAKKEIPNAKLYLHTSPVDEHLNPTQEQINLYRQCDLEGLTFGPDFSKDVVFPVNFIPHFGYPDDLLRRIYNCIDLFISTSLSEGFGVTPLEALFCGRPILIPGHTGFSNICETIGLDPVRYYPVKDDRVAPFPVWHIDEDDLVNKIVACFDNKDKSSFRSKTLDYSEKAILNFNANTVFSKYWMPIIKELKEGTEKKKAICFVQRGSAGDVFLSTSVFSGLKNRHDNLPIHYMTRPQYQNIIEGVADDVIPWKPSNIHDYEYSYFPHESRIWKGNWGSGDSTLTKIYSEILGVQYNVPQIMLDPSVDLPEEYIVVHCIGGHPYRDYYNFHIALDGCRLPVIQIGARTDKILGNGDFKFIDARGKLSYRQSAYVISKAKMLVGVDSYPMHVAGAYNVPMVITFGSGAARVTGAQSNGPTRFLEPVYSKVCPIVGPCYGNFSNCPQPCGPRHGPDIVRAAIKQLMPDIFESNKEYNVNGRLMELLKQGTKKDVEHSSCD